MKIGCHGKLIKANTGISLNNVKRADTHAVHHKANPPSLALRVHPQAAICNLFNSFRGVGGLKQERVFIGLINH